MRCPESRSPWLATAHYSGPLPAQWDGIGLGQDALAWDWPSHNFSL